MADHPLCKLESRHQKCQMSVYTGRSLQFNLRFSFSMLPRAHSENPPDGKGMNIDKVWQQGVTGKGVVVAVVDDGLQQSHPDLKDNYDPSASLDLIDFDNTPESCGNIFRIYLLLSAGIRVFGDDDPTDAVEALAFQYKQQYIDIYSCSWGPADTGWTMEGPDQLARNQLEEGTKIGRQGKGSIFVFAAGNGGRNYDSCAYNGYTNSVFTIAISGVSRNGSIPGYAERCSAVMASTYSQDNVGGVDTIITSDLNGTCTSTFAATSAATAMASGIIALALEVNPNLTWRDVQHLIAFSSNLMCLVLMTGYRMQQGCGVSRQLHA
ncbi:hypothetical protein OS493_037537 [Desmophyllum pertusum]|uniref:Peptidase S8/S53 domain-containing protein n=1 Tax=Desmophyllum pertusum TaxID=174260 RepID=A0A9W9Z6W9_9CNID|nr:hypothetical protein OS493_037537 [Desmophyllum pertusum]